jgi:predicted alpha/beta-fold hydrolase
MTRWLADKGNGAYHPHSAARHVDFRPLPLLGNPHVQTLVGNLWRGAVPFFAAQQHQVVLPDKDRLVLHDSRPSVWKAGDRIALLVHGLGGSHSSGYMERTAALLMKQGIRVVRVDLRGCGQGAHLARKTYNGACSEDIRAAATEIGRWEPSSPLILIGFSLGGNIVLKLAGEAADRPISGLERVAALAPPIDLVRCASLLAAPINRLYDQHFARTLVNQVRRHQRYFPDLPRVRFPRRLTLRIFDELYSAPRGGFADALDYYRRASSLPLLSRITVPTFILTARDDPFIAVEPFESLHVPAHVEVHVLARGGHLGFLGDDGAGGIRWAERRIADWAARK